MVLRESLDKFLHMCMEHYPASLVMRFANVRAQEGLTAFMKEKFLPVWRAEILKYMDQRGLEAISDEMALEEIHAHLYLEHGFSSREHEIFRNLDPEGFRRFSTESVKSTFYGTD